VRAGDLRPAHPVTVVVGGVKDPGVGAEGGRHERPDVHGKAADVLSQPLCRTQIIDDEQRTDRSHDSGSR
jgi:hypothetical protein